MVAGLTKEDQKKYQRRKDDADKPDAPTDILVATTQQPTEYVKKALTLLGEVEGEADAQKYRTVTLMGRGKAVATVVQVAEFLKRRVKGLHQISKIENKVVKDVWEPKEAFAEEGLKELEVERAVAGIHIQLSLDALDSAALGYQAPLPEEEVTETGSELKRAPAPRNKKPQGKSGARSGGGGGASSAGGRGAKGGRGAGLGRGGRGRGSAGRGGGRGKN